MDILSMNPGFPSNSRPIVPAAAACLRLGQTFTNNATFTPEHDTYQALVQVSWSETTWQAPACVFLPHAVYELQGAVSILVEEDASFGVRSGRHSPVPAAAAVHGDVLIDLSRFAQIEYNAEHAKVVVGAGLRWRDVYGYLDPLQGGLSYLSQRYGLSCDNVINYNVVLADGSTVNANEYSHRDLFWALKGGSNHFVTSFTLKTYPLRPQIWGGTRVIAWACLDDVLDAMLEYETSDSPDELASVHTDIGATNETTTLTLVYLEPVEDQKTPSALSIFDRFEESTILDTTGIKALTELMSELPPSPPIPRTRSHALTVTPTKSLLTALKAALLASPHLETIQSAPAGTCTLTWQPISPSLVEAGKQRAPGNALGLEPVPQSWLRLDLRWQDAANDKTIQAAGDALYAELEAAAREEGSHLRYLFVNDANGGQDVIASYGEDNVRRMREVREHYDPHSVFDRLLAGAFKFP
ncbi:FAD-binding oxidoreductase [Apiospora aurea]|uniref:FAD-binding oxidoreductase n=1 Tax=Apiospora aurea TaxID=335848 RepID=A0ABR1PXG2_9PEZI